jgi:phytol kinase
LTPPTPLFSSPAAPVYGLAIVLGLLGLWLVGVRVLQVAMKLGPELSRKLFHMGGGLVALTLPWLFAGSWPVVILGVLSALVFLSLRVVPLLRGSVGQVLSAVQRTSWGEFCFVLAIVVLFVLSGRQPVLFGAPLLVLAMADTAAALVGGSYGKLHYATVEGGRKSAEGSSAFFLAAFFCIHVPLLLFTETGRPACLLIAANVALLTMMAEAIAWRGSDNFVVPFFSFVFLKSYLLMSPWQLALHFAVIAGLFLFVYLWRVRTTLAASARLGAVLFGYTVWLLTDWRWLVPPILLFSTYLALSKRVDKDVTRHIDFIAIAAVLLPALLWVVGHWFSRDAVLYPAYAVVFAAHMAIVALVRHRHARPERSWRYVLLMNIGKGALLLVIPALLSAGFTAAAAREVAVGIVAVALGTGLFCLLQPGMEHYPLDHERWVRQAIAAIAASVVPLLVALIPGLAGFQR